MKIYKHNKAFTFIELMVVIVILSILGVVGFFTLMGYLEGARDSSKITALNNIKTTLVSYKLNKGLYPDPTSNVKITYSGAIVWNQGTFGKDVTKKVDGSKEEFVDPYTGNEYTYSITSNKKEFQIAAALEKVTSYNNSIISSSYATSTKNARAVVLGDYNGNILNIKIGGIINILAIPSIIASDLSSTNLNDIINNNMLVHDGGLNLPASYSSSIFKVNAGEKFGSNNLVIFSGALSNLKTEKNRLKLLLNVKRAYNGTIAENIGGRYLKNINIDLVHPSNKSLVLACDMINFELNYPTKCNNDSFFAVPIKNINFGNIDFSKLISQNVSSILLDSNNNIWFGTDKGISKYSSGTWTQITISNGLTSNNIKNIIQTSNGNILVATNKGISKYSSGIWTQITTSNGLVSNNIKNIIQTSNNNIWVATDKGINKYSSGTRFSYINVLVSKDINKIVETSSGNIWVATDDGANVYNGTTWSGYTDVLVSTNVNTIIQVSNNDIWVGTDKGISVYNGTSWSGYTDVLINKEVNDIFQSINGDIWVATEKGVSVYNGISWREYAVSDGLISNEIKSIFQDNNQNMWFITKKGLSKLVSNNFTNYSNKLNNDGVYTVTKESGITVVGIKND